MQLEISANLQLYRLEKENRLNWLAQTTNSSAMTQINKVLSLNKRWDYNHAWIPRQHNVYHISFSN